MSELPRALDRGLRTLLYLASCAHGASYSAIARHLAISNASATRLLAGLVGAGYLRHDGDVYHLGPALAPLTAPAVGPERLRAAAWPHLEAVARRTGHTVILVWYADGNLVCLDRVMQDEAHSMQSPGRSTPHVRAYPWGWFLPDRRRWRRDRRRGVIGSHPLADTATIERALTELDRTGYVVATDDYLHRIGAPIHDRSGAVVAAFGLAGDPRSLPVGAIPDTGAALAAAARSCSRSLGWG